MVKAQKHRMWCSSCSDWKVFTVLSKAACDTCGSDHIAVKISSLPKEKVEEQRGRYIEYSKGNFFGKLFGRFGFLDNRIIESSAGIIQEERMLKEKREQERKLYKEAIEKKEQFENETREIGRNMSCPCGSGIKFKNCCQANPPYLRDLFL